MPEALVGFPLQSLLPEFKPRSFRIRCSHAVHSLTTQPNLSDKPNDNGLKLRSFALKPKQCFCRKVLAFIKSLCSLKVRAFRVTALTMNTGFPVSPLLQLFRLFRRIILKTCFRVLVDKASQKPFPVQATLLAFFTFRNPYD